jgi:hypothetical protein
MPDPPLGVIASIASGFETVNARLELVLLPLALDLFLWLGPHLSIKPMMDKSLSLMQMVLAQDPASLKNFETMRDWLTTFGTEFNLFSIISQPLGLPLGLPSLMAGRSPIVIPGGAPATWLIDSPLEFILLFGIFGLVGLFLSALYFGGLAQQVREAKLDLRQLLQNVWRDWARLTALATLGLIILMFLSLPLLVLSAIASLFGQVAVNIVSIIGSMGIVWIILYAGFTPHGIILQRRSLFGALWDSLRLVQWSLPSTATLYIVLIVLSVGLSWVWNIPEANSWFLLIGLVGHALVSTALVAATFIYYRDRYRWWTEMRQALLARAESERGEANRSPKT